MSQEEERVRQLKEAGGEEREGTGKASVGVVEREAAPGIVVKDENQRRFVTSLSCMLTCADVCADVC